MATTKKPRKWMQKAFAKHPGKFSAKAKKHGMSTQAYARKEKHAPGALGKEARLALLGGKISRKHAAKKKASKARRSSGRR